MKNLLVAIRSLSKRGRHNGMKIVSLSVGLAVALVLIAKIYFEKSYDQFYPEKERIYRLTSSFSKSGGEFSEGEQVPGGVAMGMKDEVPGIEAATRLTSIVGKEALFTASDKQRYSADNVVLADSCLFDVLPRPILLGDPKEILVRPLHAMVSRSLAEKMGGVNQVAGMKIVLDEQPGMEVVIDGVFEDVPENSHLRYDILVAMTSMPVESRDNWMGNDRYAGYVRLAPGVDPESLRPAIDDMLARHHDKEALRKAGVDLSFFMKPMLEMHAGTDNVKNMMMMLAILSLALLFTAVMNYILIAISSIVNRTKEIAVHKSYGASEGNIHNMIMSETFVHMVISILLAVFLIFVCRDVIEDLLGVSVRSLFLSEGVVILLGICLLVFLATGIVPGILFARIPVASAFRTFKESRRIWKLGLLFLQFIAAGMLVSLLIVVGRQYQFMVNDHPGYSYDRLAFCSMSAIDSTLRTKLLDEVQRIPEVEAVSTSYTLPLADESNRSGNNIYLPNSDQECFNIIDQYWVGNGYMDLMEIPVIEGRSFQENVPASSEVMVNRAFVEKIKNFADWPDGPIGKSILITEHSQTPSDYFTICGVYEDYRIGTIADMETRPSVLFYQKRPADYLLVKFHAMNVEAVNKVNAKLQELMPGLGAELSLYPVVMTDMYSNSRRFRDQLLIGGIITLIISLIGLIGYTNDEINRRRKELAIRKVNGAKISDILQIFMSDILRIALPAVLLGCGISYFVSEHWQQQFAVKTPLNIGYFVIGGMVVCLIIMGSVVYRTWNVASDDPVNSLKSE